MARRNGSGSKQSGPAKSPRVGVDSSISKHVAADNPNAVDIVVTGASKKPHFEVVVSVRTFTADKKAEPLVAFELWNESEQSLCVEDKTDSSGIKQLVLAFPEEMRNSISRYSVRKSGEAEGQFFEITIGELPDEILKERHYRSKRERFTDSAAWRENWTLKQEKLEKFWAVNIVLLLLTWLVCFAIGAYIGPIALIVFALLLVGVHVFFSPLSLIDPNAWIGFALTLLMAVLTAFFFPQLAIKVVGYIIIQTIVFGCFLQTLEELGGRRVIVKDGKVQEKTIFDIYPWNNLLTSGLLVIFYITCLAGLYMPILTLLTVNVEHLSVWEGGGRALDFLLHETPKETDPTIFSWALSWLMIPGYWLVTRFIPPFHTTGYCIMGVYCSIMAGTLGLTTYAVIRQMVMEERKADEPEEKSHTKVTALKYFDIFGRLNTMWDIVERVFHIKRRR